MESIIRQTTHQVMQMKFCVQRNDWNQLKKITHTMKPSFIYLNMVRPIELADFLINTSDIDIETTTKQVNELSTICLEIISELKNDTINQSHLTFSRQKTSKKWSKTIHFWLVCHPY